MTSSPAGERIRRRAVVGGCVDGHTELVWTEAVCRGCVGCGGRCSLFGADAATPFRLPSADVDAPAGTPVDVEVDGRVLRGGAARAYGIALLGAVAGAAIGHAVGLDVGALVGLLAGTFLAGRLTKRLDAAPPLRVRPCPESDSNDPKELPR